MIASAFTELTDSVLVPTAGVLKLKSASSLRHSSKNSRFSETSAATAIVKDVLSSNAEFVFTGFATVVGKSE